MKLDKIDRSILNILQNEGRMTASKIAEDLGLTVPTITERIRKLEDSNIITSFQAVINHRLIGLDVTAMITVISSSSESYKEVIKIAQNTKEVIQCFSTTGMGSLMLWIATKNSKTLEELLRKIQSWPNVTRTETQVILSSYKKSFKLPVQE
ncbi:MAG: AsnC family transcriptional regulator [Candidatus Marinimicrobia bacterium]|nr:AsnC family transcriptional regulator [Candidatus Neomarinimicrobiota bacterium]|tara:strand:+ start:62 stop:517 length:456 start_codon:yes stop_codon:yes gene_type:complete